MADGLQKISLGARLVALMGIFYDPAGGDELSLEGCEVVFRDHGSIVFTTAPDWTLMVGEGAWPALPAWCWPPESWRFSPILETSDLPSLVNSEMIHSETDEPCGINLYFSGIAITIRAGGQFLVTTGGYRS
jgi:hypothetical protein